MSPVVMAILGQLPTFVKIFEKIVAAMKRDNKESVPSDKEGDVKNFRKRPTLLAIVGGMLFSLIGSAAFAATTVNLAWDANTEPDLAGYKLYQSASINGTFAVVQPSIAKVATTTSVTGLTDGNWCWKLTAFDTVGNESGFSNTVCFQADTTPPATPNVLRVVSTSVTP